MSDNEKAAREMHAAIAAMVAWSEALGADRRKRKRLARKAREAALRDWNQ